MSNDTLPSERISPSTHRHAHLPMVLQLNQPSSMRVLPRDGGRRQGVTKVRAHLALDTFKQRPAEGQCGESDAPKKLARNGLSPRPRNPRRPLILQGIKGVLLANPHQRRPRRPLSSPCGRGTTYRSECLWRRADRQGGLTLGAVLQRHPRPCHPPHGTTQPRRESSPWIRCRLRRMFGHLVRHDCAGVTPLFAARALVSISLADTSPLP